MLDIILLTQLIEMIFLYTSLRLGLGFLTAFLIVNMLSIPILGHAFFEVWGWPTNVGTIYYANVMLGILLILKRYGVTGILQIMHKVFFAMVAFLALSFLISTVPVSPGREEIRSALSLITEKESSILVASFLAFYMGNGVLIAVFEALKKRSERLAGALALTSGQLVDSLIFYTVAFSGSPALIGTLVFGFVLKVIIGVLSLPIFEGSLKRLYG